MKKIQHFLEQVTSHIQSKEAKRYVATELQFHLQKSKSAWLNQGLNEEEAESKAIQQMGSPIQLGRELNQLHKPKIDWLLISLLVITMGLGFLPIVTLGNKGGITEEYFLINKSMLVVLGAVISIGIMLFDYRKLQRVGWLFYAMGIVILIAISYFPTHTIYGTPQIDIGPLTIESFLAIPFFFIAWAAFFTKSTFKLSYFILLFTISFGFFLNIPTLSVTFIYAVMVFVMFSFSKIENKKLLLIGLIPIVAFGIYVWRTVKEYQVSRILGFLHPEKYPDSEGYMYLLLKERLATAGWFGAAGSNNYIPQAHTDFAFAGLTYYFGYFIALLIVIILTAFVVRMMLIFSQVNHHFGKLLIVGATTIFITQFIYHIGMTVGIFPIVSIPLPFISYGIMPTLLNAFLIGIVLSVYRRKNFSFTLVS